MTLVFDEEMDMRPYRFFGVTQPPRQVSYGFFSSPFGRCLIAMIPQGLCYLSFIEERGTGLEQLKQAWPHSQLKEELKVSPFLKGQDAQKELNLALKGTLFQQEVWQALALIPKGKTATYQDIAQNIGRPLAVRAVARAIAANPIAYVLPCHRVIGKTGALCGYRWGVHRKQSLLNWDAGQVTLAEDIEGRSFAKKLGK